MSPTVQQFEDLRAELVARQDDAVSKLRQAQALFGTPASQVAKILEVIGDHFDSVEITSPDKDVKPHGSGYNVQGKQIAETGWVIRLSKTGAPLTVINNYVGEPVTEGDSAIDDPI